MMAAAAFASALTMAAGGANIAWAWCALEGRNVAAAAAHLVSALCCIAVSVVLLRLVGR